jgi:hypothetical protein
MILIYAFIMLFLSFAPILGVIASGFLGVLMGGGLIYGASQLDGGGKLEFLHLFQAFRDANKTGPMLILGLVSMIASLLMGVVGKGLVGGIFTGGGLMSMQLASSTLIGLLLLLLVVAVLVSLLFYAIPLVMLRDTGPIDAIKTSVMGSYQNWLPLLVFGLVYLVLAILASIPLWLGFLILGPVTTGAWYQSYKDIF